jgi:hypothetical protein
MYGLNCPLHSIHWPSAFYTVMTGTTISTAAGDEEFRHPYQLSQNFAIVSNTKLPNTVVPQQKESYDNHRH